MDPRTAPSGSPARRVVELACGAPSVHNTQPWLWRVDGNRVDLYADRSRQLLVADPAGRNLLVSCGAALHQARVAAQALGTPADVVLVPDPGDPDHLARLELRRGPRPADAVERLATLARRVTDRRRFTSWPVAEERLALLAASVTTPGVRALPLVDTTTRFRVELLVERARDHQLGDARLAAEQRSWVDRGRGEGVPSASIPEATGHAGAPVGRFTSGAAGPAAARTGLLEGSDGLLALCTDTDEPHAWLATGEALSQLWLAATVDGLSVVPLSQVVEVPSTRGAMRTEVLGGLAHPQVLVRLGWQELGRSQLPRTPRRPVGDVLLP
ncbi:Acg family FMN-binding oxidoreductase [Nocardioides lijunqiniae]|uniref:Acg family FMN-binding oxidoreductase n=1 Tax=Nocardioides lijunqiniae TaxID=2760832 RepID=UPI001877ED8B|nr:NAD(P)H nitroreductase [Nocardioides lijunqiniae]